MGLWEKKIKKYIKLENGSIPIFVLAGLKDEADDVDFNAIFFSHRELNCVSQFLHFFDS